MFDQDEGFSKVIFDTHKFLMEELYGQEWNPVDPSQDPNLIPVLNDAGEVIGYQAPNGADGIAWE